MITITAPLLDIAVLVLGMLILLIEAFAAKIDKRILAYTAITRPRAGFSCQFLRRSHSLAR